MKIFKIELWIIQNNEYKVWLAGENIKSTLENIKQKDIYLIGTDDENYIDSIQKINSRIMNSYNSKNDKTMNIYKIEIMEISAGLAKELYRIANLGYKTFVCTKEFASLVSEW